MPPALRVGLVLAALALGGCAHTPPDDPSDPLEPVNRAIFSFNLTADEYVLRPVARGYDKITPAPVRTGIRNFFANLFYPTVMVNDLLQLKFKQFGADTCRFVINTLIGWGGIFDVATKAGLPANDEDFGQTLGYWGVGPGWYLMIPLLGPANNRDLIGKYGDWYTAPLTYVGDQHEAYAWSLGGLQAIEDRANLLPADKVLEQQIDKYVFVRSIYLQTRLGKVYDGNPPKEDFDFGDD